MTLQIEAAALGRIMTALDQNQPARSVELSTEEAAAVRPLYLLTMKPMVYAANVAEDDLADLGAANKHVQTMRKKAAGDSCELIIVSAQVRPQQAVWLPWQQKCCCCCNQGKVALLHLGGFLDQYLVQDSTCSCRSRIYHSKGFVDSMITAFCSLTVFSRFTPQKQKTVFVMKQAVSARFHMQAAHLNAFGMQKLADTICFVTSMVSCFRGCGEF